MKKVIPLLFLFTFLSGCSLNESSDQIFWKRVKCTEIASSFFPRDSDGISYKGEHKYNKELDTCIIRFGEGGYEIIRDLLTNQDIARVEVTKMFQKEGQELGRIEAELFNLEQLNNRSQ